MDHNRYDSVLTTQEGDQRVLGEANQGEGIQEGDQVEENVRVTGKSLW
jgi:hypothetical protein